MQGFAQCLIAAGTLIRMQVGRLPRRAGYSLVSGVSMVYLYCSRISSALAGSRSRWRSSSIIITGAWSQAPRQTIGNSVKRLSAVVSPSCAPRRLRKVIAELRRSP